MVGMYAELAAGIVPETVSQSKFLVMRLGKTLSRHEKPFVMQFTGS